MAVVYEAATAASQRHHASGQWSEQTITPSIHITRNSVNKSHKITAGERTERTREEKRKGDTTLLTKRVVCHLAM